MPVEDKTVSWYEDFASDPDRVLIDTIQVPAGEVWYLADYLGVVNEPNTRLQIDILQGDGSGNTKLLDRLNFGGDNSGHNFNIGQYVVGIEDHSIEMELYYNGSSGADTYDGRGHIQIRRIL